MKPLNVQEFSRILFSVCLITPPPNVIGAHRGLEQETNAQAITPE
jgi:hypothetical protein